MTALDAKTETQVRSKIARRLKGIAPGPAAHRLVRSRLRQIGDEIGEPLLTDMADTPSNFVSFPASAAGVKIYIAMPRTAAEKILALN